MVRIDFLHYRLDVAGGAEAVLMNAIEALQDDHRVRLITSDPVPLENLNQAFGTEVEDIEVVVPHKLGLTFSSIYPYIDKLKDGRLGIFSPLRFILFHKFAAPFIMSADVVFNTKCEMGGSDLQYVHFPKFGQSKNQFNQTPDNALFTLIDSLLIRLEGLNGNSDGYTLTNSEWSQALIESVHEVESRVIYPPIRLEEFNQAPPVSEMEDGFIMLGKIYPEKRQLEAIDFVTQLRARGHDIHLHIAGPVPESVYAERVLSWAEELDYIAIEGRLPRAEYVKLIQSHKYGFHGMPNEHFGVVVAEMIAGECLPFVPNSGGQVEIVNSKDALVYDGIDDAVDSADSVLRGRINEKGLRQDLTAEPFSASRFNRQIQKMCQECLSS